MLSVYLTYAVSITLLISSPGPIVSLVISDAKYGWPKATILGSVVSAFILLLASLLMIHFTLSINEQLLEWGRIIGGAYLVYLGFSSLRADISVLQTESHHKDCFWRTMKVGLSNPKDILFFLAFLPSFISQEYAFIEQAAVFILIWVVIDVMLMSIYAGVATKLLTYKKCQIALHYIPGIFMLLVGVLSLLLGIESIFTSSV